MRRPAHPPREAREGRTFVEGELARRPRGKVEPDRGRAGANGRDDPHLVRDAADLDHRRPGSGRRVERVPAGTHEGPRRSGRVRRTHQGLTDERRVKPGRAPARDRRDVAHARLGDDEPVLGNELAYSHSPLRIDLQRPQVAVVDPDHAGVRGQCGVQLPGVVRLDQRLQPQIPCLRDETRQPARRMKDSKQQDEVGAGGAEQVKLPRVNHELLGQDRNGHRRAHRAQVVHGAAEPVGLAQDGDGRGSTGGVCSGPGDRIVPCRDRPRRRRPALDLGDQVKAGLRERLRDRARRIGPRPPSGQARHGRARRARGEHRRGGAPRSRAPRCRASWSATAP